MMGIKAQPASTNSPKKEVGEIDTRAPFESVKAAVSLFGEVAFSGDKSTSRKQKSPSYEKTLATETKLHIAQKELNKFKEQLHNAETTRVQALAELEKAKEAVEELTQKLITINESKEEALKVTEAAKSQTKLLEQESPMDHSEKDVSWKNELDSAREQYAAALSKLDAAKLELRRIRKEFNTSMDAKVTAIHQEFEAKQLSDANKEKAAQLAKDIAAVQESLVHVKLATEQAQQDESKIRSEKETSRQSYKLAIEENEAKLASLKKDFNPELHEDLKKKLEETEAQIDAIQKQMKEARASDIESIATVTTELDGAKEFLQKVVEEETSLRSELESLKLQLEILKKENSELQVKDAETEALASNLHLKLQKCKSELESAMLAESKASSTSDDLTSALQQLSAESLSAQKEAEETKMKADELRSEAEAAKITLAEAEVKLQVALRDAEEAKAAETRALNQIKELSEKANAVRSSTSESGAKITISREEYESLSRKVEESEKLTEMKVAAAMAQVEAVRASENEAIKRLEAVRKEIEDLGLAAEDALKRADMAEAAKKAVEGELRRWREKEQKRVAETATQILAETTAPGSVQSTPPRAKIPKANPLPPLDKNERKENRTPTKKALIPVLSGMFNRKKSHADGGGSPSFTQTEKHEKHT
ncbi:WEB family protein At5g55860 [Dendrobium catenatum]|uniref:WEB family protein n=1 Tax=Dendrobium catenatum TaxID=906689 RepID=A0A2I0W5U9_9ASPA|nr:WEB family protein At5g55860 [Dendrobium catenatum]PKU71020.1 WEB family protein [Dendrobium catenatum]